MRTARSTAAPFLLFAVSLSSLSLLLSAVAPTAAAATSEAFVLHERLHRRRRPVFTSLTASSSSSSLPSSPRSAASSKEEAPGGLSERDAKVGRVLELARKLGPVGSYRSDEERQQILDAALSLAEFSDPQPAQVPLVGTHRLVYSDAEGGSSGKLFGPVAGKVEQRFVDSSIFQNAVRLGPLRLTLTASREIMNDDVRIRVAFQQIEISLFDRAVSTKQFEKGAGGVWKMVFVGAVDVQEDGGEEGDGKKKIKKKLVRVFQTPSLFVTEQDLSA